MSAHLRALPPPALDPLDAEADALDAEADAYEALARAKRARAAAVRARSAQAAAPTPAAPLLTPSECASALGVSIATLNRRVNEGIVPFVPIGDSRRFDLAAVRAALEVSTASEPRTKPGALPQAPDSGPELVGEPSAAPAGVRRVSVGGRRAR